MTDRRTIAIALALTTLLAAGCGASTSSPTATAADIVTASPAVSATASPAATQATTGRIEVADRGFALTLPDGWESFPVDPAALEAIVDDLPPDSEMRTLLEGQMGSAALAAIAFWAFDVRPERAEAGQLRNMNVIAQPPSTLTLSLVESAIKTQLGAVEGIGAIDSEIVTLPAGEALRFDYELAVPDGAGGTKAVATTQYYIPLPKSTLIVSFSSDAAAAAEAASEFEAVIGSLEALP